MKAIWRSLVISLALLAGCSSPQIQEQPAPEFADEGLYPVRGTGFESAYVLPDADLPSYGRVSFAAFDASNVEVTSTTVTGTTRGDWEVTPERQAQLVAAWERATNHAFAAYPREDAGAGELRVEAQLLRISPGRSTNTSAATLGSSSSVNRDVVNVSVEIRIHNAASGQLLAVVRDRQAVGALQWKRTSGAETSNLLASWAALLHTRISGR